MSEVEVKISSERIDDIPLIVEWLSRIEIAKYIDQKMKKLHGNHQGMSYGQLSVLLLTYIITQSDHRLCAVEAWVETHRKILELTTGWLATLDPMGMPLVSATLEGNGADDPLYFPTWEKIVKVIGHKNFVFIAGMNGSSNVVFIALREVLYLPYRFTSRIKTESLA